MEAGTPHDNLPAWRLRDSPECCVPRRHIGLVLVHLDVMGRGAGALAPQARGAERADRIDSGRIRTLLRGGLDSYRTFMNNKSERTQRDPWCDRGVIAGAPTAPVVGGVGFPGKDCRGGGRFSSPPRRQRVLLAMSDRGWTGSNGGPPNKKHPHPLQGADGDGSWTISVRVRRSGRQRDLADTNPAFSRQLRQQ